MSTTMMIANSSHANQLIGYPMICPSPGVTTPFKGFTIPVPVQIRQFHRCSDVWNHVHMWSNEPILPVIIISAHPVGDRGSTLRLGDRFIFQAA